ncbi:Os05g0207600 [Oryza sativa Japonica Group]|uniref:Os05g0207600 protein n=1 Tax=Oryza sativa subsp. japonica TaxID=39947 RepID=A0A0P0WJC9_ORYSJ|nr:hypothetical protein EE612_027783 [Oryza sativa]BAS92764.1 Os05g0207600 [Oryza sativa Japonica Group]
MLQGDDIGVVHGAHKLKLTVLVPSVLQYLLNGNSLSCLQAFSLKDDTERTSAHNALRHARVSPSWARRSCPRWWWR